MSAVSISGGPPVDPRLLRRVPAVAVLLAALGLAWAAEAALLVVQAVAAGRALAGLADGAAVATVGGPLAVFAAAGLARVALGAGREAGAATVGARARAQLRGEALRHTLAAGGAGRHSGETALALGHGFDALDAWFAGFVPALVGAAVVPPALVVWMLVADPTSGVVVALTVPLVPAFMVLVGLRARVWAEGQFATLERLSSHVVELLRGLPMLWMLRRERPQEEVLARLGDHLRTTTMAGLRVAFLSAFVLELVAMLGTAVVAVTIGLRLVHGDLPLATGFALLLVTPEVYARLRDVGVRYHASREGSLAAGRVLDLLDASPATAVAGRRPAPDPAHVDVVVHGVTVVAAGREPALVDADLVVPAGRLVVLVGPSGAGKTTLARVVAGIQAPDHGHVTVGDVALVDVDPTSWRRRVAWVPAWPAVPAGTLRDAVTLGGPAHDDAEVRAALAGVGLSAWVQALPRGLDTGVGPGVREASGGERARLGLARALLRTPGLLVVDEPTAHLDGRSAAAVHAALVAARDRGITVVAASHDPALVACADRVAQVAGGHVRTGAATASGAEGP